jgi:hypothetical protein
VDESVDGDVQMAMFEEASTTKMFPATARSRMVYACFRDLLSSASRAEPITVVLDISADRIPLFADAFPPHAVAAIAPTVLGLWRLGSPVVMSGSCESRSFDRDNNHDIQRRHQLTAS